MLKQLLKENKAVFLIILAFAAVAGLNAHRSTWDPAVYVGMGKYIYSGGQVGLWEPARPIMLPLWLGLFWKLGLEPFAAGALFSLLLGVTAIYVFYLIIKELCDKKTATIFSLLFAMNLALISFSKSILTDIPAMLFSLAATLFAIRKRFFSAGILIGAALLTKFTSLMLMPIILAGIFFSKLSKHSIKNTLAAARDCLIGCCIVAVPYFMANALIYKNPIYPLLAGQRLIQTVVGNYTCPNASTFFAKYALVQVPLLLLSVAALYFVLKERDWRWVTISLAALVPFAYHSFFLNCKDIRYAFAFLPYFYILVAKTFSWGWRKGNIWRYALITTVAAQLIFSTALLIGQGQGINRAEVNPDNGFYQYLAKHNATGKVWSSTPEIVTADVKIDELVYYPVFDNKKISELTQRLHEESENENIQHILINTCDIPCVRYDPDCPEKRQEFLDKLDSDFQTVFHAKQGECNLSIYGRKMT